MGNSKSLLTKAQSHLLTSELDSSLWASEVVKLPQKPELPVALWLGLGCTANPWSEQKLHIYLVLWRSLLLSPRNPQPCLSKIDRFISEFCNYSPWYAFLSSSDRELGPRNFKLAVWGSTISLNSGAEIDLPCPAPVLALVLSSCLYCSIIINPTASWFLIRFVNHWATMGTP